MPEMTVCRSPVGPDLEGRVLLGERLQRLGHLVLIGLGLRLHGHVDHGVGELEH